MSTPYVSGAAALVVSEFGYSGGRVRCGASFAGTAGAMQVVDV